MAPCSYCKGPHLSDLTIAINMPFPSEFFRLIVICKDGLAQISALSYHEKFFEDSLSLNKDSNAFIPQKVKHFNVSMHPSIIN